MGRPCVSGSGKAMRQMSLMVGVRHDVRRRFVFNPRKAAGQGGGEILIPRSWASERILLAVIAAGLARASWRKSAQAVSAVALILIVGIGSGPVAGALVQGLQAGYPAEPQTDWGGSSVIILLGGGTERVARGGPVETNVLAYGRLVKALELYLACKRQRGQCTILASGGDPRRNGISEAAVYGSQLRKLGVDPADILCALRCSRDSSARGSCHGDAEPSAACIQLPARGPCVCVARIRWNSSLPCLRASGLECGGKRRRRAVGHLAHRPSR